MMDDDGGTWEVCSMRPMPTLLVDVDGVLANQGPRLCGAAFDASGGRFRLEPGDITAFDFPDIAAPDGARLSADEWREALRIYGRPEVIRALPVVPGAAEALGRLAWHYRIAIVTSRDPSLSLATKGWLGDHFDFPYTLDFVPPRAKHMLPGVAIAVDDDYDQAANFSAIGVPCRLMAWPWNDGRPELPLVERVDGWQAMAADLEAYYDRIMGIA